MRVDFNGPIEDAIRKISTDLNISGTVITQILLDVMIENISYEDMTKIVKVQVAKVIKERKQSKFAEAFT